MASAISAASGGAGPNRDGVLVLEVLIDQRVEDPRAEGLRALARLRSERRDEDRLSDLALGNRRVVDGRGDAVDDLGRQKAAARIATTAAGSGRRRAHGAHDTGAAADGPPRGASVLFSRVRESHRETRAPPRRRNAHRQPGGSLPARSARALGSGRDLLRGHARDGEARGALRDPGAARLLPRPARGRARRGAPRAARARRDGRARHRRRDAGDVRPGERLVAAAAEAGYPVEVVPGPVRARRRPGGLGPARRPPRLPGLPAGPPGRAQAVPGGPAGPRRDPRLVRGAPPAPRVARGRRARCSGPRRACVARELTKLHEEAAARDASRARRDLRARAGRDAARSPSSSRAPPTGRGGRRRRRASTSGSARPWPRARR